MPDFTPRRSPMTTTLPPHPRNPITVVLRQRRVERALARRGISYRSTNPAVVGAAYAAMSEEEFEAINGPQSWANWRTIPRALAGRLPDRPWTVIDLGCGTGTSTRVLAAVAPPGSEIIGYELVPEFLTHARRRRYLDPAGGDARVRFVCQGVSGVLRDGDRSLPDRSVDVANSSGVLGHHLNPATARPLAAELGRVMRTGGIALLDFGPTLRSHQLIDVMRPAGFQPLGRYKCVPLVPSGQVAFRKG
jgi:SAM-dependent methyltransferase